MRNDLTPAVAGPPLTTLTTEALRQELAQALELTSRHLLRLAEIWRELERRGEDLSSLRGGLWTYLPLIATGKLRAELVVKYAGQTMLLRRLAELLPEDQERILLNDEVVLVEYEEGEWRERRIRLPHLKAVQISQVLADGRIRAPVEQRRAALSHAKRRPTSTATAEGPARRVAAAALERGRPPTDVRMALSLPLTHAEDEALRAHATQTGVPVTRLVRAALEQAGLLRYPAGG